MLIDTDALIDYMRGWEPVRSYLRATFASANEPLQTTVINQFELLAGAREPAMERVVEQLLQTLHIVPLDSGSASMGAKLRRDLLASGLDIGMADSLIAGVALAHHLPLFTRNRRHFSRVSGLRLVEIDESR